MIDDALAAIGKPLDPDKLNANIFYLLKHEYHLMMTTLNSRKDSVSFMNFQIIYWCMKLLSSL